MPGIYGIYSKTIQREELDKIFYAMGEVLRHRNNYVRDEIKGPNAIIGKIGFQENYLKPVWNDQKTCVILLDGAIFSYVDELGEHEIENHEVILRKLLLEYDQTGTVDTRKLNGEFNLVIYEPKESKLLISNDRWGFRELYYYGDGHVFLFAPEMKALLRYSGIEKKLNEQAVADFLNYGYILGDRTLVEGIWLLAPGGGIKVGKGIEFKVDSYKFSHKPFLPLENFDEYVDIAHNLLDKAVQRRLRGRERIAACLSGGLDSRIITAIAVNHTRQVDTYTLGTNKKGKEYAIAKQVARITKRCNNFLARTMPEHVMKYLNWAVWASDGNASSLSSVSAFFGALAKPLIDHDLLLGGFVGDLILGGSFLKEEEFSDVSRDRRLEKLMFRVGVKHLRPFAKLLFHEQFGKKVDFYAVKSVEEEFGKISDAVDFFPFQQDLFVILTRCRRGYNVNRGLIGHVIIEEYYPFFDNSLFDFLYSLPPEVRLDHKLYIAIYKKYFPALAKIPWLKTGVSLYDEESSISKKKRKLMQGIRWYVKRATLGRVELPDSNQYAPENEWYRKSKSFRCFIADILLDTRTLERGYLREDGIRVLLQRTRQGWNYMALIGRLCAFELWCRLFLDGDEKIFLSGHDFGKDISDA